MPPRLYSRHSFVDQVDNGGSPRVVYLSDRTKFLYLDLPDNRVHTVKDGDNLRFIAAREYAALSDPPRFSAASLWWAIADFQPQPIHDPTIVLTIGGQLILPSLRTVRDKILNPAFRRGRGS